METLWTRWLRQHRRARGWSIPQAAERAGISFHAWRATERDEIEPGGDTLDRIADAFGQRRETVHEWHDVLSRVSTL